MQELDVAEDAPPGMPGPVKGCLTVTGILGLAFFVFLAYSFEEPDPREEKLAALELEREPGPTDDHLPLRFPMDEPAYILPPMEQVPASEHDDDTPIVGVVVGSTAHAFVLRPTPERDVLLISTRIENRPIVISHNYLTGTTRVLTSSPGLEPLDVRHGGWQEDQQLVLLWDGNRYRQDSKKLALDEWPFEETSLQAWIAQHPNSLINRDEELTDRNYYSREARAARTGSAAPDNGSTTNND